MTNLKRVLCMQLISNQQTTSLGALMYDWFIANVAVITDL